MGGSHDQVLAEFAANRLDYEKLGSYLEDLLAELLSLQGLKVHSVTHRVKAVGSLSKKLDDHPEKEYSKLEMITDLLGLRVITHFADEVDRVKEVIRREFDLDLDNCVDKRATKRPAEFGYASLHLVASLNTARLALTENQRYLGMRFEVQVRTILQHAWAEIEHDHVYKPQSVVPETAKRLFARIAADLEGADDEFQRARDAIASHSRQWSTLPVTITTSTTTTTLPPEPPDPPLDGVTIVTFAEDAGFLGLEEELQPYWKHATRKHRSDDYLRQHAAHLIDAGVATIQQLRHELARNRARIVAYSADRSQYILNDTYPVGWSMMQMAQVLQAQKPSEAEAGAGIAKIVRSQYDATDDDISRRLAVLREIVRTVPEKEQAIP